MGEIVRVGFPDLMPQRTGSLPFRRGTGLKQRALCHDIINKGAETTNGKHVKKDVL